VANNSFGMATTGMESEAVDIAILIVDGAIPSRMGIAGIGGIAERTGAGIVATGGKFI